jgi:NitT/TauT family transport system ATP-binding protein
LGSAQGARIEVTNGLRRFAGTGLVIDNLNVKIESGEFVSLLGPSGCGKSTLLRLFAGLDVFDQGQVTVESFGRAFFRGFVFQEAQLLPWRTVLTNVSLPGELMGLPRDQALASAREALIRVGLEDSLEKYPNQLSGGMKMRVSVARALVNQPSLLLLDEPFAALDENTRHRLQEDLRSLWEALRMTVVFVTHSISEATFLSDRTLVLSQRPARVLLDHKSTLPMKRSSSVRTDSAFLSEQKLIASAYDFGGLS